MKRIPILFCHSVDDEPQKRLAIPTKNFIQQMTLLQNRGYNTITLQQYYDYVYNRLKISSKSIILTFDDGYEDNYRVVFPILKKFNFIANFFITTEYVGTSKIFPWESQDYKKRMAMTWSEINEMADGGMLIGSHTCTHPLLDNISLAVAQYEIFKSKEIIENKTKNEINFFAYPAGKCNQEIMRLAKNAGYIGACTTRLRIGQAKNIFCLERIGVFRSDNLLSFSIKLFPFVGSLQKLKFVNAFGKILFKKCYHQVISRI